MRGITARLEGDAVPVHPSQEGVDRSGPSSSRRSGSEKRRRNFLLIIRLTDEERAAINQSAERAGLSAASYARRILLDAPVPRQARRPPIERRDLARLLGHMGHIGSNLNQIARALNSGDEADMPLLAQALVSLRDMRDAVLTALGRSP